MHNRIWHFVLRYLDLEVFPTPLAVLLSTCRAEGQRPDSLTAGYAVYDIDCSAPESVLNECSDSVEYHADGIDLVVNNKQIAQTVL